MKRSSTDATGKASSASRARTAQQSTCTPSTRRSSTRRARLRCHQPRGRRHRPAPLARGAAPGARGGADPARHRRDARGRARRRPGDEDGHQRGAQSGRRVDGRVSRDRRRRTRRVLLRASRLGPGARVVARSRAFPPTHRCSKKRCRATAPFRVDDATADEQYAHTLDEIMPSFEPPLRSGIVTAVRSRDGDIVRRMILAHPSQTASRAPKSSCSPTSRRKPASCSTSRGCFARPRWRSRPGGAPRRCSASTPRRAPCSRCRSTIPESFERLGRLCVPFLADLCLIDVAEEHGVRRLAAIHADPDKATLVAELEQQYPPDRFGSHPAASVVRGGKPEFAATMSDRFLRSTTRDERHFHIVKELDFTSYMCVPLEARGRVLGALTLVSSGSGRRFGAADLALAEEFARRAGLALDNARLYSERDHVARLQSSLLPPSLPEIPGARHGAVSRRRRGQRSRRRLLPRVPGRRTRVVVRHRRRERQGTGSGGDRGSRAPHAARAWVFRSVHRASCSRTCTRRCSPARRTVSSAPSVARCCSRTPTRRRALDRVRRPSGADHPAQRRHRGGRDRERARSSACRWSSISSSSPVELGPGDMVVLYTDGVTEAHHRNQPLFGEERLMEVIGRSDERRRPGGRRHPRRGHRLRTRRAP